MELGRSPIQVTKAPHIVQLRKLVRWLMPARAHRDSEERLKNLAANVPGVVFQRVLAADGTTSFPYISPGIIDTDMQVAIRSADVADFPTLGRFQGFPAEQCWPPEFYRCGCKPGICGNLFSQPLQRVIRAGGDLAIKSRRAHIPVPGVSNLV